MTPDTEGRGTSTSITLFPGVPNQQIIHKYVFDERTQESLPAGAARDRVVAGSKGTPGAAAESSALCSILLDIVMVHRLPARCASYMIARPPIARRLTIQ